MQLVGDFGLIATSVRTLGGFAVHQPPSCAEAVRILATTNTPPTPLAGGTDLCAQCNEGLAIAELVALRQIEELRRIEADLEEIRIGSCVTLAEGAQSPVLRAKLPGFAASLGRLANVRIRYWATIGGNLMARRTGYEMSILLTALCARLRFLDSDGVGELHPEDLWRIAKKPRALLWQIAVPLRGQIAFGYERSLRPVVTLALALSRADGWISGRAVVATERLAPVTLALPQVPNVRALSSDARDIAASTFAALPADFADAVTSGWYLHRAGQALLARELERAANG